MQWRSLVEHMNNAEIRTRLMGDLSSPGGSCYEHKEQLMSVRVWTTQTETHYELCGSMKPSSQSERLVKVVYLYCQ